MISYNIEFFTPARLREFWSMIEGLLKFASPSVLIFVAIMAVGMVLTIAIKAFKKGAETNDQDKDFDIKYYD